MEVRNCDNLPHTTYTVSKKMTYQFFPAAPQNLLSYPEVNKQNKFLAFARVLDFHILQLV